MRTYTTKQGDTWDSIAYTQLGSGSHTDKLMSLNMDKVDYFIFPAGVTVNIPEVDENTASSTLPPWKRVSG